MLQKLEDLRFSIGAFFLIVGILLLIAGATQEADAAKLNFMVGVGLIVFAAVALGASIIGKKES